MKIISFNRKKKLERHTSKNRKKITKNNCIKYLVLNDI
jgi:hypothetical protein